MKRYVVVVKATVEVEDKEDLNKICLCVAEEDSIANDLIPYLKTDYFEVIDYLEEDFLEEEEEEKDGE